MVDKYLFINGLQILNKNYFPILKVMKRSQLTQLLCILCMVSAQAQIEATTRTLLPPIIKESSGLLLLDNQLITHNDSGNSSLLYFLDTLEFNIQRSVKILGVSNTDWEDLAADDQYIYVADIGNNRGTRRDLKVLKIDKYDILNKDGVFPKTINFKYEDQLNFEDTPNNDWDAEALISWGDSLLIFSKQRQSGGAAVYAIPKTPGDYTAKKIKNFENIGLITGATKSLTNSNITLVGYTNLLRPFLVTIPMEGKELEFPYQVHRQYLSVVTGQTEGVCSFPGNRIIISSEAFSNNWVNEAASLFEVNLFPEGKTDHNQSERK